jgi:beta-galactosidase GanA
VKFLSFTDKAGKRLKRYQYTAPHGPGLCAFIPGTIKKCAVDFVDYVRERFPSAFIPFNILANQIVINETNKFNSTFSGCFNSWLC